MGAFSDLAWCDLSVAYHNSMGEGRILEKIGNPALVEFVFKDGKDAGEKKMRESKDRKCISASE